MWLIKNKGKIIKRLPTRKQCNEWVIESLLLLWASPEDIEILKETQV